jgi:hypothetical protein
MGIQMSKASVLAQGVGKDQSQDDMTKATDNTEGGSSAPSSPRNSVYTNKQSQRRTGSFADSITRAGRSFRQIPNSVSKNSWRGGSEPAAPQHTAAMTRTYSDPMQPANSSGLRRLESLPVKCPPRRPKNASTDDDTIEECEESDHLMRMYDARTWALYTKITEHRKHHPAAYNQSTLDKSASDEVAEWNKHSDMCLSPRSGQEMIFVFDLD